MNWERNKINTNNNNLENFEVSCNVVGTKCEHLDHEPGTHLEPIIEKVTVTEDFVSHHKTTNKENKADKHEDTEHDSGGDDNTTEENDNDDDVDETDSPRKKISHFVRIEEEDLNVDDVEDEPKKHSNTYAAKKTVAQGMMDIALITANANQLRYLVEFNRSSPNFFFIVILIIISLCLQIAVGVALIFKGRLDMKGRSKDVGAKRINNYVVVCIFLITIVNVFVASFTITGGNTGTRS